MYLYPENLTARPMLWLWTLRDVAWIGTGLLLSVLALTQTGSMIPLVITAALAFLCIRHGGISMLDFLRYAAAFFFFGQQYLWLSNPVAIEYIRNCLKRVRKRDSALVMASQNLEDFDQEGVREMTKPLFAIPPHQFLFNPGSIGKRFYMDMLQLDEAEFELIQRARRGECLYKCGMERYHLEVKAPTHKAVLFGSAGGR